MTDVAATTDGDARESRALTGLRGLGALLVLSHHLYLHLGVQLHLPSFEGLLRRGFMGVDLFFVLSGFVLSMVYAPWFDEAATGRATRVADFLVRRVARLWPLHAAMLLVLAVVGDQGFGAAITPRLFAVNLAMLQAWGFSAEINPPAWSVSTELLAYIVFPTLVRPVLRWRHGPALGLLLVAVLLATCLAAAPPIGPARRGTLDIYFNYSPLPALRCLAGFITGMLAWRAGQRPALRRAVTNAWAGPAALAGVLALLLARTNGMLVYPLLPLVVLCMHHGRGLFAALFARGPVHWLGTVSYAVYLLHYAVLMSFPLNRMPLWAGLPAYLGTVLALAALAHALIERPGRALLRRLGAATLAALLPSPLRPGPPTPM